MVDSGRIACEWVAVIPVVSEWAAQPHVVLLEASDNKILSSPQNNVKVNLVRGSASGSSASMTL